MRASASSAPPNVTGPFGVADAKAAGSGAGPAAASETSGVSAAGDRNADSSHNETSGQPFAAALASAQVDSNHQPGTQRAVAAPIDGVGGDAEMLLLAAEANLGGLRPSTVPAAASEAGAARMQAPIAMAADSAADCANAAQCLPAKTEGEAGKAGTATATGTKPRAGKHTQTAPVLDGAALSTLAALLGAAAAQTSVAAPVSKSEPAPSAQRSIGNGADAGSAAALAVNAKHLLPRSPAAEDATNASTSIAPSAADRDAPGADKIGASADSFAAARAEGASASSASTGSGLAPMMQSLSAATATVTARPTASIDTPVAHPSWANALAAQVQWMATRQVQSATLRLSPEHLGPLEVRIDVMRSQINVNFTAHHPDTREALAQAVPQLRQLFAAGGLNLGEATVRQEPRSSEQPLPPQSSSAPARSETVEPVANTAIQRLGLIDEYA
jgi:flagellar hook-length control protein FliK